MAIRNVAISDANYQAVDLLTFNATVDITESLQLLENTKSTLSGL